MNPSIPFFKQAVASIGGVGVSKQVQTPKPLLLGVQQPQAGGAGPVAVGAASPNAPADPNAPDPSLVGAEEHQKAQQELASAQAEAQASKMEIEQYKQEAQRAKIEAKQMQDQTKHQLAMTSANGVANHSYMGQKLKGVHSALNKLRNGGLKTQMMGFGAKYAADAPPVTPPNWKPIRHPSVPKDYTGPLTRSGQVPKDPNWQPGRPLGPPKDLWGAAMKKGLNPDWTHTPTWSDFYTGLRQAEHDLNNNTRETVQNLRTTPLTLFGTDKTWEQLEEPTPWDKNPYSAGQLGYWTTGAGNVLTKGVPNILKRAPGWAFDQFSAAVGIPNAVEKAHDEMKANVAAAGGWKNTEIKDLTTPWQAPLSDVARTAFNFTPTGMAFNAVADAVTSGVDSYFNNATSAPTTTALQGPAAGADPGVLGQIMEWVQGLKSYFGPALQAGADRFKGLPNALPSESVGAHNMRNPNQLAGR